MQACREGIVGRLKQFKLTSINPDNGETYWEVPYEATSGSIIMAPIQAGDYLYVAGYSKKSTLLKLASDKPSAEVVWRDKAQNALFLE